MLSFESDALSPGLKREGVFFFSSQKAQLQQLGCDYERCTSINPQQLNTSSLVADEWGEAHHPLYKATQKENSYLYLIYPLIRIVPLLEGLRGHFINTGQEG